MLSLVRPFKEDAWGALLAGQALTESAKLDNISPRNCPKVKRIQEWLAAILMEQMPFDFAQGKPISFPAVERALAGNILAQFGDLRPGVGLRDDGLPDIEWCGDSEGLFLSRYPVTNAQYQAFIDDGGYGAKDFWIGEKNY